MKRLIFRILRWGAGMLLVIVIAFVARGFYAFRDRVPGYTLDLKIDAGEYVAISGPSAVNLR